MQTLHGPAFGRVETRTEEVFTLRKGDWVAECHLTSHASQHGKTWELRLFVSTPENELRAAYCDSQSEVFTLGERWKTKLLEKGWTKSGDRTETQSHEVTRAAVIRGRR